MRHGIMIIGETLSGKTCSIKSLCKTLNDLNELNESELRVIIVVNMKWLDFSK